MLTIDWTVADPNPPYTGRVFVPQSYLTLVTGTLYSLDTEQFRLDLKDLEDDETGIVFRDTHTRNAPYVIAGVTYAQAIGMVYEVEFEDGQYSVRLDGSNNDIFDVEGGILVQNQVQVIPTNSAGLVVVSDSGLTPAESAKLTAIAEGTFGQKVMQESTDPANKPGYVLMYDDTADPFDDSAWVLLGHKPIWVDGSAVPFVAPSVGWTRGNDIAFEGALVAGAPPP